MTDRVVGSPIGIGVNAAGESLTGPKIKTGWSSPLAVLYLAAMAALTIVALVAVVIVLISAAPRCADPHPPRQISLGHQTLAGCP